MPLALQLVPPLFLLAGCIFFMGVFGKELRHRRYWLVAGVIAYLIVIGLAVVGFRQP
jgi:energy-coupling factor transporter transmembrane protein EcfT